ncbi:hypothetical protein F4779DRAFT_15707 [Xylariaceae sp. FL0662B]|nr:hypothetical protein F4779DRAFT_15707 [Xylariaceae sp. FL0662B]
MGRHSQSDEVQRVSPPNSTRRTKVKTGCLTCKVRKVKCDEGRPACHRCISTGRVCDGYGIWGGGGNDYGHRSNPGSERGSSSIKNYEVSPSIISATSDEDRRCLEWFTCRTVLKLPGAFDSSFWDTLVFRASSEESAVMHAVLALSSAHRRDSLSITSPIMDKKISDEYERYILRHYSKAIAHLQWHFTTRTKDSIRVALVTCLVFVAMEYLRGRHTIANTHLQSGLKLLEELWAHSGVAGHTLFREPYCDSVDAWISQAFTRLDTQSKMLGYGSHHPQLMLEDSDINVSNSNFIFESINQARRHFDRLFSQIFHLDQQCRQYEMSHDGSYSLELHAHQRRIKRDLDAWFRAFKASRSKLQLQSDSRTSFAYKLLRIYHTMANIMVDTLYPPGESRFDIHTANFNSILNQTTELRDIARFAPPAEQFPPRHADMTHFTADLGGKPPLYYTALKCRVHRIRLRAIELLNALPSNDGAWNSPLVASVAREVVKMEEESFSKDFDIDHNLLVPNHSLEGDDTLSPLLPESSRFHDVCMGLPDECNGKVTVTCKRRRDDGRWEVLTRECTYTPNTK